MGLLDKLQALGCQLKLVQVVPKTEAAPEKIETRNVTLQELKTQVEAENVRILAESPVESTIAFDKIFETAGIKREPGQWTIERLISLLQTRPYNAMHPDFLLRAVVEKLAFENVSSDTLVKDALAKDQALDAFETFVREKMQKRLRARRIRQSEIEKQIDVLHQEKEKLQQEDKQEQRAFAEWQERKQAFEKEMMESVDLLMSCKQDFADGDSK